MPLSKTTDKVIKELKKANLSTEDRIALTTALLDKLVVLPFDDILVINEQGIKIKGKEVDLDGAFSFREHCVALKENVARKILREQVRYMAVQWGVHNGLNLDTVMFSKAVLWCMQEEDKLLDKIV